MSVEKEAKQSAATSVNKSSVISKEEIVDDTLSSQGEVSEGSISKVAFSSSSTNEEAVLVNDNVNHTKSMRAWFEDLSAERKSDVLSFTDESFLRMLAALASWSTLDLSSEGLSPGKAIDWRGTVSIKEVKAKYLQPEPSKLPLTLADDGLGDKHVATSDAVSVEHDSKADEKAQNEVDVELPRTVAESEGTIAQTEVLIDGEDVSDQASTLFANICALFPAVSTCVSDSLMPGHLPLVTLKPEYFEALSDKELFLTFDSLSASAFNCKFMENVVPNETSWLSRLEGISSDDMVPIFALLMARWEWEACQSFLESQQKPLEGTIEGPIDNHESSTMTPSILGVSEGNTNTPEFRRERKLVREVIAFARSFDLSLSAVAWEELRSPLDEVVEFSYRIRPGRVEDLFLLSFESVLFSCNRENANFEALNKSVGKIVALLQTKGNMGSSIKEDSMRIQVVLEQQADNNSSKPAVGKKKKKKKKSRNKKKSSSTESVSAVEVSALGQLPTADVVVEEIPVAELIEPAVSGTIEPSDPIVVESLVESIKPDADHSQLLETEDAEAASVSVASVNGDSSMHEEKLPPDSTSQSTTTTAQEEKGVITVSRIEGQLVVAAPLSSKPTEKDNPDESERKLQATVPEDEDQWEMVEVRGRGNRGRGGRRKPSERGGQTGSRQSGASGSNSAEQHSTSGKNKSRVDSRKGHESFSKGGFQRRKNPGDATSDQKTTAKHLESASTANAKAKRQATEVIDNRPKGVEVPSPKQGASTIPSSPRHATLSSSISSPTKDATPPVAKKNKGDSVSKKLTDSASKTNGQRGADQNTAPTYQETVSAVSTVSNVAIESKVVNESTDPACKSYSSDGDTDDAPQNRDRAASTPTSKDVSPTPPLPTLLSPPGANSTTSSVASSLEVPHAGHRHHHSNNASDVNDVGYHLLDVCNRLSSDMSLFMSRRALALNARRRERGALLAALQEKVSSIWPSSGHVEMYGSCAVQLDLPSSDLDVVVVGLDRNMGMDMMMSSPPHTPKPKAGGRSQSFCSDNSKVEEPSGHEVYHSSSFQRHNMVPVAPFVPMIQRNADRVIRLAAELEGCPWAVKVNPIPTASVPVIKVLADPSRLETSVGGDWMAHHQHLAAHAAAMAGRSHVPFTPEDSQLDTRKATESKSGSSRQQFPSPTLLPWRGSDVMNGLVPLDITFEGFEHGGIGSTEFSVHAVAEACRETGLHPDATPFVQVVMVLKELLAQRKLNEPYSGGLSSYALLLLVIGLLRERAFIREEIERVERQKKAMSAGDENPTFADTLSKQSATGADQSIVEQPKQGARGLTAGKNDLKPSPDVTSRHEEKLGSKSNVPSSEKNTLKNESPTQGIRGQSNKKGAKKTPTRNAEGSLSQKSPKGVSSWASIAKKNTAPGAVAKPSDDSQQERTLDEVSVPSPSATTTQPTKSGAKKSSPQNQKPPTFADAVTRSAPPSSSGQTPRSASQEKKKPLKNDDDTEKRDAKSKDTPIVESKEDKTVPAKVQSAADTVRKNGPNQTSAQSDSALPSTPPYYPQGFNDVIEVLCSGETTAGKLLMHFLLYYGEHFDAQATAIDISGKHQRDYSAQSSPYSYLSPYIQRRTPGSIDPITGVFTVDPIVIYDPLEGRENSNVARRCFAWNSIRWIFAQSYQTLSSAVERSATSPSTPGGKVIGAAPTAPEQHESKSSLRAVKPTTYNQEAVGDLMDPSSPLLRCLLSF